MFNVFFLLQLPLIVVLIVYLVYLVRRAKLDKTLQTRIIEQLSPQTGYNGWKRVYVARPEHFRKKLKLLGYEGRGVLVNYPDHIQISVSFDRNTLVEQRYPKTDLNLEWVGNPNIGSSNLHWVKLGTGDKLLMLSADTGFNAITSREETADICRIIQPQFVLPTGAVTDFALEKNPASLCVVVVFFLLAGFAVIDGAIINEHRLLNKDSLRWVTPAALLFGILCYNMLTKFKVPSRESYGLSLLLSLVLVGAYIPAIKRADQILAHSVTVSLDYKLLEDAQFQPVDATDAPNFFLHGFQEYWGQFEPGSTHRFDFIHGPLGLWQLDETELNKKYQAFYKEHDPMQR